MTDRLTKHQLKDDVLLQQTAKTVDYMSHHARLLFIGAAVVVVVAAGILFYRSSARRADEQAAALVQEAAIAMRAGDMIGAASRLETVTSKHGGSASARRALILLGDLKYSQGDFSASETAYRQAAGRFDKDDIALSAALAGQAAALENLKRFDEAAAVYDRLTSMATNDVLRAEYLLDAARGYRGAGKAAEAEARLTAAAALTANPRAVQEAKLRLAELKAVTGR